MAKVMRRVLGVNGMREIEVNLPDKAQAIKTSVSLEKDIEESSVSEDIYSMSGAKLKEKCKELGISTAGSNSAKINRILEALNAEDSL